METDRSLVEILGHLQKPLHLEKRLGYTNQAVLHGFDQFFQQEIKQSLKLSVPSNIEKNLRMLSAIMRDYGKSDPKRRAEKVSHVEQLMEAVIDQFVAQAQPVEMAVQFLKGVGPKRAVLLKKLSVETVADLLYHFPRRYEDRSQLTTVSALQEGVTATIEGEILACGLEKPRPRLSLLKAAVSNGSGIIYAVWFNQPYLKDYLPVGTRVILSGKVERYRELQIVNPAYEILTEGKEELIHTGRIVPIYPLTGRLNQKTLRTLIKTALDQYASTLTEYIPISIRQKNHLVSLGQALREVHFPPDEKSRRKAYQRLVFDEFFLLQLGMLLQRAAREKVGPGISHRTPGKLFEQVKKCLPFRLTTAQKKVIKEIQVDLARTHPMTRLVQGDVGSGKTIVALSAMLTAVENNFQAAFMAPTEVLAEQHFLTLQKLLLPLEVKVSLLIGSLPAALKKEVQEEVVTGETDIMVGTHTLIQEAVEFKRLGLVIIDEQHRFGVSQRAELRKKGLTPDLLVMTATPIPRTLALTVYGDLDVSILDEMPAGRKPVATYLMSEKSRVKVYQFLREEMGRGHQVYIVYPLVEESDKLDLKAAVSMAEKLQRDIFPEFKVGLLHGKMRGEEKEKVMTGFKNRDINLMVSTTVIEVGIDIPNATVMVIEEAERFGLAQLHQLRGRVGRSKTQSYCILIGEARSAEARRRLQIMSETVDGFQIAMEDLALRGPGEFLGTRQHGLPELAIGNIVTDMKLLALARREALNLLRTDPKLSNTEHRVLHHKLQHRLQFHLRPTLGG